MPPATSTSPATLSLFRYAVHHSQVKVLIFFGYELYGEVKLAQMPVESLEKEMPMQLPEAMKSIRVGLGRDRLANLDGREVVTNNLKKQVEQLESGGRTS